jgi:hypothetical protein
MDKTLKLALSQYPLIPHTLRVSSGANAAISTLTVGLASLYHHYYLDSYGRCPPNPDPAQFEHVQFLLPTREFRLQGSGLGISPAIKRHRSNELGQAFCRWFLHDHLNITYFAHLEHVLNRQLHRAFAGCRIERAASGDTPDYFCAESVHRVFLAEAKGRYTSVSFKNKEFDAWREQFERVVFKDASGSPRRIKGHIVATRFATEEDSVALKSGLYAEDPTSPGDGPLDPDSGIELGTVVLASHYSNICMKLGQPLLAAALASGVPLPEELQVQAVVWHVLVGPLQGRRFVGGYFGSANGSPTGRDSNGKLVLERSNPLRLDSHSATFFGVDESIFRQVVYFGRSANATAAQVSRFETLAFFYSGFSVLRDGSALGPIEFFSPVEQVIF